VLAEAGLADIEADARLPHFKGGSELAAFFKHTLAGAAVELVARGELTHSEVQRALAGFDDRDRSDWGWPRIAASGRRPG
jgi:hypothetical protein